MEVYTGMYKTAELFIMETHTRRARVSIKWFFKV